MYVHIYGTLLGRKIGAWCTGFKAAKNYHYRA